MQIFENNKEESTYSSMTSSSASIQNEAMSSSLTKDLFKKPQDKKKIYLKMKVDRAFELESRAQRYFNQANFKSSLVNYTKLLKKKRISSPSAKEKMKSINKF